MNDLRTVVVRDVVIVREISMPSRDPPMIRLRGEDFSKAYLVTINGIAVTDFKILSKEIIEFVLPEALRAPPHRLSSVDVYSETFTSTPTSFLEPRLGSMPATTRGLHKLVQQYVKILMTKPGTNVFDLESGGGLSTVIGALTDQRNMQAIVANVMSAINRTSRQVFNSQYRRAMPADERLKSVQVADIRVDPRSTGINIKLLFESEAGKAALSTVGLTAIPGPKAM